MLRRSWLPLVHIATAAARHAAASGLPGAEQPVEDALGVMAFFLGAYVEPSDVQHGLQLAIQTVGSAAATQGHAAGVADGSGMGSSSDAGDIAGPCPGLGGVLRAFSITVGQLVSSGTACGEARHENAQQGAWGAAWLMQSIAELCAVAEACERLAVALVPALADGRILAGGLDGAESHRLAHDLASQSHSFITMVAELAMQQLELGRLGQEGLRALLWLSLTSAKAVHASLALPPAQLRLFDPDGASGSRFTPCESSLGLACLSLDQYRQAAPAVEQG